LILAAAAAIKKLAQSLLETRLQPFNLPAAAAGSEIIFLGVSGIGLPEVLGSGLLLRLDSSSFTAGGDLERLSNLEVLFGSGSFWSKRDRFTARRSVSSISNSNILVKGCTRR
jgi:hypothetical protein